MIDAVMSESVLPLRNLPRGCAMRSIAQQPSWPEREMKNTRRTFLKTATLCGAALVIGFRLTTPFRADTAAGKFRLTNGSESNAQNTAADSWKIRNGPGRAHRIVR